jgi:RNA polymerase sigma-70 factor, ECF subfamily
MLSQLDSELVRRTLAGDDRAFGELVDSCQTSLYNVALRFLGNREDARDVVQAAFIKAYTKLHTYDPRYRFFAWIHRIVINEALNAIRRRRKHVELDDSLPDRENQNWSPELESRNRLVQEALMRLPLNYRQVIVLRYWSDLSHSEIAEVLGVPEKTVKSRLFSARQLLIKELIRSRVAAR